MPDKKAILRFENKAMKFSGHKTKWHILSFEALEGVCRVMHKGLHVGTHKERQKDDWKKGTDWMEYWDALIRHATAWRNGEDYDQETQENHLHHMIACGMILVWYQIRGVGKDDRQG